MISANSRNSMSSSNSVSSLTSSTMYGGLIDIPVHKQLKNALFALSTHIDSTVPNYFILHKITSFIRLFQFLGPSFCVALQSIIPRGTSYSYLAGITSIFYHLIPTFARDNIYIPIIITYEAIILIYLNLFVTMALVYRKTAKIGYTQACILDIFSHVIAFIIHPIGINMTGEYIGQLIKNPDGHNTILSIIVIAVSIIFYVGHYLVVLSIFVVCIAFRPLSLPTVDSSITYHLFLYTGFITLFTSIGTQLDLIPSLLLFGVAFAFYIYIAISFNYGATFYSLSDQKLVIGCSISGAINLIVVIVFRILGKEGKLLLWMAYFASAGISFAISSLIVSRVVIKHFDILDTIEEDGTDEIAKMSRSRYLCTVVSGFRAAHPVCISFKIFDCAAGIFENDPLINLIYAKFVSIYPEASRILDMISTKIVNNGIKTSIDKQIVHQILSVSNKRQNVLSPGLKKKITEAQKHEATAKRKLLNIWDLVIQGNINELDVAIDSSYKASNVAELELVRLKAEYPNNTFVARAYLRFMSDIRKNNAAVVEENEKIRKLRRGVPAAADHYYELGIIAFPNIPSSIDCAGNQAEKLGVFESVSGAELDIDDECNQVEMEQNEIIKRKINDLKIPSIYRSYIWLTIITLILILAPSIILLSLNNFFVNTLKEPTTMMFSVSYMRQLIYQIGAYVMRLAIEELPEDANDPDSPPMGAKGVYYKDYMPTALGGTRDSRKQLSYLINQVSYSMQNIDSIREYRSADSTMDEIRDILFGKSVIVNYTTSLHPPIQEEIQVSPIDVFLDVVVQASRVLDKEMNTELVNRVEFLNPQMNTGYAAEEMRKALSSFVAFTQQLTTTMRSSVLAIQISVSIIVIISTSIVTFYSIVASNRNMEYVFRCLISLPKVVVSQAAEAQRMVKKNSDSISNGTNSDRNEINKQEENIMKVFMSAADSTSGNKAMKVVIVIASTICITMSVASMNIICELFKSQTQAILKVVPHIDYVLASVTYMYATFIPLNCMVLTFTNYNCVPYDADYYLRNVERNNQIMKDSFDNMRFGGTSVIEIPYGGFNAGMEAAAALLFCEDVNVPPKNVADAYACSDGEFQMTLYRGLIKRLIDPYKNDKKPLKANWDLFNDIWVLGPIVLYDTFLYPMFLELFNVIERSLDENNTAYLAIVVVLLVISVIMMITIYIEVSEIEKRIRYALTLFLQVQPSVVLTTPKIVSVLSGNFKNKEGDQNSRTHGFYDEVVAKLIDCVITTDETGKINMMNKRVEKDFGAAHEDYIGKNITEFFENYKFEGNINAVISGSSKTEMVKYNDSHYNIMVNVIKGTTVLTLKNETSRVVHSNLIAEERSKSDKMLASILPAALVPRVQAGESNISFAVQSASVLFLDIVSFTPWCGSNQSAYVMKVLNRLFKDLDRVLAEYPTLTKVKCIGDCYMAAGGIFAEVNQPAVHAKEMVEFGLRSIEVVKNIDQDLNEKLQIRVGINTGGPLVAGVLGTAKPTFEILGPTINMAQQMEHHGVPMKVHISRATYELIYGSNFKIKERGEIEVKHGKVNTYLVSSE